MGGGDPTQIVEDANTGFPQWSSGEHLCVQYSIYSGTSVTDWKALVDPKGPSEDCITEADKLRIERTIAQFGGTSVPECQDLLQIIPQKICPPPQTIQTTK
jgi:hypothetical protein